MQIKNPCRVPPRPKRMKRSPEPDVEYRQLRGTKLIINPKGFFRLHEIGNSIPDGWIIVKDESVFHYGELLDRFKYIPYLQESDYGKKS